MDEPAVASPSMEPFGSLLRRLRTERGLSQEELAAAARIHVRTVQDLERGKSRSAQPANARRLADALDLRLRVRDDFLMAAGAARGPAQPTGQRAGSGVPAGEPPVPGSQDGTHDGTRDGTRDGTEDVSVVPHGAAIRRSVVVAAVVGAAVVASLAGWALAGQRADPAVVPARGRPDPGTRTTGPALVPVQDTFLQSDTEQAHDREVLKLGLHPSGAPTYRALLQFDLSSVPVEGLRDATLRLWTVDSSSCEESRVDAYPVTSDWRETDVTWARQPEWDTDPALAGGDSFAHGHEPQCANSYGYIDVTAITRAWLDGRVPNRGLTLRADETDPNSMKHVCSSELAPAGTRSTCTDPARFPTLLLRYSP